MKNRIMQVMADLEELPGKINAARSILINMNANHNKSKAKVEGFKAQHVVTHGGWSTMGKNEGEREMNLSHALRQDRGYAMLLAASEDDAINLADAKEDYDNLCRQFDAVKVKAALLTAYLGHYPYTTDEDSTVFDEIESILGM